MCLIKVGVSTIPTGAAQWYGTDGSDYRLGIPQFVVRSTLVSGLNAATFVMYALLVLSSSINALFVMAY